MMEYGSSSNEVKNPTTTFGQFYTKLTLNQTKVTLWVSPDTVQVNVTSVPDFACISGSSISEISNNHHTKIQ